MTPLRIPLRAVFYKEEGNWVAHCLEFDLLGHGSTKKEALESLSEAIFIQLSFSVEHDNLDNLFSPADGKYLRMFAAGKDTSIQGQLKFEVAIDSVTLEGIKTREYSDSDSDSELASV